MRLRAAGIIIVLVLGACHSSNAPQGSNSPSPSPSPTGTYDPNAPRGGGTFTTPDGRMRFTYPPPWHIDAEATTEGYIALYNFTLTGAEQARREAIDAYGFYDGEAKIEVSFGSTTKMSLARIRKEACRVEFTTLKVRECTTTKIHGRTANWILLDHSNDGDCTCREVDLIVGGFRYGFSGGGCIPCSRTADLLDQIERIFRSVIITR